MIDKENVMKRWDKIRELIDKGDKSDQPRMIFENILEDYEEEIEQLKSKNNYLRGRYEEWFKEAMRLRYRIYKMKSSAEELLSYLEEICKDENSERNVFDHETQMKMTDLRKILDMEE